MATDSLDLIKHNLQEMYCAVQTSPQEPVVLVTWGDKLYSAKSSWVGRIISWIDSFIVFFCSPNFAKNSVNKAILKTHQLFEEHKKVLEFQIDETEEALARWTRGVDTNLLTFDHTYQNIRRYQEATRPFLKLLFHNNVRLKELLSSCINAEITHFHDKKLYQRTGKLSHIHQLICLSGGSLPLNAFKQAVQKPKINPEDQSEIKRWVKTMRDLQGTIDNRALCKGLTSLVDFWNRFHHDFHAADIEEHLMVHHPDYLLPDPKHIKWRDSLHVGSYLEIDPKHFYFTLAEPLKPKTEGFDNNIAYAIKDTNSVMMIGQNRSVLRMRNHIRQNPSLGLYGVRSYNFVYVDPKGCFAIGERLRPIKDPKPIIGQLSWLVEQPYTPTDLNFRHLALTNEGYLVSVKSHGKGPFNYSSLEQLAYDFANENLALYEQVIKDSGLIRLPHARFFSQCILKGLYQEEVNFKNLVQMYTDDSSMPHDIWNPEDAKHGEKLYHEARQISVELRQGLVKFKENNPQLFDTVWKEELYNWWKAHATAGRIWPNLKIKVPIAMAKKLKSGSLSLFNKPQEII